MKYYVYRHIHPETKETVYVGKGCYGRAWDVTRNRGGNPEHLEWCKGLADVGYLPSQWVVVDRQGLEESEALRVEKNYLHTKGRPQFNRQSGEKNYQAKLTDQQARDIFQRIDLHKTIAQEYGVSRSCISMIKSRKQWKAATACLI